MPTSVLKKRIFVPILKERVNLAVSEAAAAGFQLFPGPPDGRYSVIEK